MIIVCPLLLSVGDRHHLIEIAVGVSLGALLDETASGVVGVACRHAVGRRRDELIRGVESEGYCLATHGFLEHVTRLVVGVAFNRVAVRVLNREELALLVVLVRLADAIRGAGDDLSGPRILAGDCPLRVNRRNGITFTDHFQPFSTTSQQFPAKLFLGPQLAAECLGQQILYYGIHLQFGCRR